MITNNGMLEIEEQEDGVYVFPNSQRFASTWALYVFNDGRADLYVKRDLETGALLGAPQPLGKPVIRIHPLDLCEVMRDVPPPGCIVEAATFKTLNVGRKGQEIIEVYGKRYFQTISVPAKTTNLK